MIARHRIEYGVDVRQDRRISVRSARGFGTLSYFLEIARMVAKLQADRIAEEQEIGKRLLGSLCRPLTEQDND